MHKFFILMLLSAIFLFSAGCAKYWYQEGKSFEECGQSRAECFEELKKRTDFGNTMTDYEIKFMNECMQAKGYKEVSTKELPLNVKRKEANRSLNWRTRGVAGTLTEP